MIEIKTFQREELELLKLVFMENTPEYFAVEEWKDLCQYLDQHAVNYYCLWEKDQLIGAGGYRFIDESSAQFHWNFLAKAYQHKGLGSYLLKHCIQEVGNYPAMKNLEVWTSQHAEGFYGKFGFKAIRRQANYWADGLHLVQMKLDLNSF